MLSDSVRRDKKFVIFSSHHLLLPTPTASVAIYLWTIVHVTICFCVFLLMYFLFVVFIWPIFVIQNTFQHSAHIVDTSFSLTVKNFPAFLCVVSLTFRDFQASTNPGKFRITIRMIECGLRSESLAKLFTSSFNPTTFRPENLDLPRRPTRWLSKIRRKSIFGEIQDPQYDTDRHRQLNSIFLFRTETFVESRPLSSRQHIRT